MIKKIKKWLDRHAEIRKEVDQLFEEIEALSIGDAYQRALEHIEKYPMDFEIVLNQSGMINSAQKFDSLTEEFFKKYEEVYVIQGDARIRLFDEKKSDQPLCFVVCKCEMDDVEYAICNEDPTLLECKHEEEDSEEIKSIFHLILMSV